MKKLLMISLVSVLAFSAGNVIAAAKMNCYSCKKTCKLVNSKSVCDYTDCQQIACPPGDK